MFTSLWCCKTQSWGTFNKLLQKTDHQTYITRSSAHPWRASSDWLQRGASEIRTRLAVWGQTEIAKSEQFHSFFMLLLFKQHQETYWSIRKQMIGAVWQARHMTFSIMCVCHNKNLTNVFVWRLQVTCQTGRVVTSPSLVTWQDIKRNFKTLQGTFVGV